MEVGQYLGRSAARGIVSAIRNNPSGAYNTLANIIRAEYRRSRSMHGRSYKRKSIGYKKNGSRRSMGPAYRRAGPSKRSKLSKRVSTLEQSQKGVDSILISRTRDWSSIADANGNQGSTYLACGDVSSIEAKALPYLRYYDPSTPGTLVTADASTGTYHRNVRMRYSHRITIANNYQVPVQVQVLSYQVKKDTSVDVESAWTNGLADISNGLITDMTMHPSDSPQVSELWTKKKAKKRILQPGEAMTCVYGVPYFDYSPDITDSHNLQYQASNRSSMFLVVCNGVICHDSTTANNVGVAGWGIDIEQEKVYTVKYNAGGPALKYIHSEMNEDTFVGNRVVSNKPTSDNQSQSVA